MINTCRVLLVLLVVAVSLPFAWTDDGLPLCLQVAGRAWGEAELITVAKYWQRWRDPRFVGFEQNAVAAGIADDILERNPVRHRQDDFIAMIN